MSPPRGTVRLQKFLSDAGVASRRHAEDLIRRGRVLVNGEVVDELPAFIDPQADRVVANGVVVRAQRHEYFLVHKPKNVVCTNRDPSGRTRAVDLLPPLNVRLFAVGRLDADSTGLLLMTNDGELAQQITHPRFGIPKTYRVEVHGRVQPDLPQRLADGVHLAEGKAHVGDVAIVHAGNDRSTLLLTLREGRNRQVRRMLVRLGYRVKSLKRVQIGPLTVKKLPIGASRRLTPKELSALRTLLEQAATEGPSRRPDRRRIQRTRPARPGGPQPKTSRPRKPDKEDGPRDRRLIT